MRHMKALGQADEARAIGREMQEEGRALGDVVTENLAAIRLSILDTEMEGDEMTAERTVHTQREALRVARCINDPLLLKNALTMTSRSLIDLAARVGPASERGRRLHQEALTLGLECHQMLSPHSRFLTVVELALFVSRKNLGHDKEAYAALKSAQQTALSQGMPSVLMSAFYFESREALKNGNYPYPALLHGALLDTKERLNFNKFDFRKAVTQFRSEIAQHLRNDQFETFVQLGRSTPPQILVASSLDNPPGFLLEDTTRSA
jgi:hypothetical protein